MVMKQPEVTARTRARLRRAFWKLYEKSPIEKVTVKQITDLAGYNRATFYLYYDSVYDLLNQEEEELIDRREAMIGEAVTEDPSGEGVRIRLNALLEQARRNAPYLAVLLGPHGDPKFVDKVRGFAGPVVMHAAGLAFGDSVSQWDSRQLAYLREFYFAGMIAMIRAWLADSDPMPLEELAELIVSTFMPGAVLE